MIVILGYILFACRPLLDAILISISYLIIFLIVFPELYNGEKRTLESVSYYTVGAFLLFGFFSAITMLLAYIA